MTPSKYPPFKIDLPNAWDPLNQKKLLIFDMDETLMHCVDDVETDECEVILDVDFGDGDVVYAGINIRPHIKQCLREASKNFMVIVFTASH
jgi:TFIIF-interacting CTD phosphatase-like protein